MRQFLTQKSVFRPTVCASYFADLLGENLNFDPTSNIIDVYVGRVRRKVDNQHAYPLIHTIRGVGFCVRAHS
jgi:DNA-binding response OmpR family regulator